MKNIVYKWNADGNWVATNSNGQHKRKRERDAERKRE